MRNETVRVRRIRNQIRVMKRLFAITIAISCFVTLVRAQQVRSRGGRVLLEARYFGEGMSGITGDHLIARIHSNGLVEYEEVVDRDQSPHHFVKTARLNSSQLTRLFRLLTTHRVSSLADHYEPVSSTIDHTENLTLKIFTRGRIKRIVVENFKPDLPRAITTYPRELLDLACWATLARNDAQTKFFFRESDVCSSAKKFPPFLSAK